MSLPEEHSRESQVYIGRVPEYTPDLIRSAIVKTFDQFGGLKRFFGSGCRVLIKPNLICSRFEAQTHPLFVVELALLIREAGAEPFIGDSPAWGSFYSAAKASGLYDLARRHNLELVELSTLKRIVLPDGRFARSIVIAKEVLSADFIVNVPKLKTHQQMLITAGVKNIFGVVPGKLKAWWHFYAGRKGEDYFAGVILEIYRFLKPRFTLIDAVDTMEGRGPISGRLRRLGVIIGSTDALASEFAVCRLLRIDPKAVPIIRAAAEMNILPDKVRYIGEDIEALAVQDFELPELSPICFSLPRLIKSTARQVYIKTQEIFSHRFKVSE